MNLKKISIILWILSTLTLLSCSSNQGQKENEGFLQAPNTSSAFSREDLIYFVLIDRFSDGDSSNNDFSDYSDNPKDLKHYLGGDLQGIIDQLDYIKGLGTTTLWLSPVVENEPFGYHGYWTKDFYAVNPHFGDMETLKTLVDEAHKRDIKVLLDYIVNHTGYQHPWLLDPEKKDWFHNNGTITNFNDQEQVETYNLAGLPDLNTENPQVKDYIFENVLWWIDQTGVDGLRLDTVRHVPIEFWNEFSHHIKSKYPDFYLLGEVWKNSASLLESYHQVGLDGLTNYSLYNGIENTFKLYGDANTLKISLNNENKFTNPQLNGIFLDNHDVSRLMSRSSKFGDSYLKQGLTFIMTYPAMPIIYYGTEIGLEGKEDPDNRRLMDFEDIKDNEIYNYYQELLEIRVEMTQHLTFEILNTSRDVIGILYPKENENILTIFNISQRKQSFDFNHTGNYEDYFTKEVYEFNGENTLELEGLSTLLLKEIE
jgi:alpha-amylase